MADLIDRQAAQRLFGKALTYKERIGKLTWTTSEVKQWLADCTEQLPPALRDTDTDTISRQAAIDVMCSFCGHDCDKSKFVYNAQQDEQVIMCPEHYVLSALPSAQSEIIQCKDCKEYDPIYTGGAGVCGHWNAKTENNAYCSYADRRKG